MSPPGATESARSLRPSRRAKKRRARRRASGTLTIVGSGIAGPAHTTPEAIGALRGAERVFVLVADPLTREWLRGIAPRAESLADAYAVGRSRWDSYEEMVERMLGPVRRGRRVCALFYGHPGVFAYPSHEAIRRARAEGHRARMLPAVSAEDCLFAELGVDPGRSGCQSYEATDFVLRPRAIDRATPLVLWQIGLVGIDDVRREPLWSAAGLGVLTEVLLESYPKDHEVVVYEASTLPIAPAKIVRVPLGELPRAPVTALSTLYVAPAETRAVDPARGRRLGLS